MASLVNVTPASQVATVEVNNRQLNVVVQKDSKSVDVVLETRGDIAVEISRAVSVTGVQQIIAGTDITISPSNGVGNVTINANVTSVNHANTADYATTSDTANTANVANSVDLANVVGIGTIASVNLDNNVSNILHGDGSWGPEVSTVPTGISWNNPSNGQDSSVWVVNPASPVGGPTDYGNVLITVGNQPLVKFSADPAFESNFVGNVVATNFVGDGSLLSNIYGPNVTGVVYEASIATTATYAAEANSVAVYNVVGLGNIATINLDDSDINVLHGNGVFAPVTGNISANYASYAGEIINNAQPNITSVGTLASLDVLGIISGDGANIGNITGANITGIVANASYAANADYATYAGEAYYISGGNVNGTVANANYSMYADTASFADTAYSVAVANVVGIGDIATINLDYNPINILHGDGSWGPESESGNANYANFAGTAYSVSGSNVVGEVANAAYAVSSDSATTAATVTDPNQSNITSVGTLSGLSISGMVTGNLIPAGNVTYDLGTNDNRWKDLWLSGSTIHLGEISLSTYNGELVMPAANIAGDLIATGNANISSDLNVTGNALINGNLTVNGNTYYTNVETLVVEDPIIEQGGGPNGDPLTNNDGKDRGELLHYYTTQPVDAFMGWSNANSEFIFGSDVTNTSEVIGVNTYGNVRAQHVFATIDGANVVGEVQFAGHSSTAGDASTAGYATTAGHADSATNSDNALYATTAGAADFATVAYSVDAANVVGLGNIATINLDGNASNILYGNGIFSAAPDVANANYAAYAGNITVASQPNITSVGTLTSLTVSDTATIGNLVSIDTIGFDTANAPGVVGVGQFAWDDANGSVFMGMKGGNVNLVLGENEFAYARNETGSDLPKGKVVRVTGASGNRLTIGLSLADNDPNSAPTIGFTSETIINNNPGLVQVSGTLGGLNTLGTTQGAIVYLSGTTPGGWTTTKPTAPTHTVILGWIERVSATVGSIYIKVDNGYELDELHNVLITTPASGQALVYNSSNLWVNGNAAYSNTAGTVTTNAQPNITSLGILTSLAVTGSIAAGNVNVSAGNVRTNTIRSGSGDYMIQRTGSFGDWQTGGNVIIGGVTTTPAANLGIKGNLNFVDGSNVIISNIVLGPTGNLTITTPKLTLGPVDTVKITGGTTGQVLSTDGLGNLSWATAGGGTPGGSTTELQYNNAGTFGGMANVTYAAGNLSLGSVANVKMQGGTTGQVLSTDGLGNLSWTTPSSGGTPAGSDTQLQFNNAGVFGASANLAYDPVAASSGVLTVGSPGSGNGGVIKTNSIRAGDFRNQNNYVILTSSDPTSGVNSNVSIPGNVSTGNITAPYFVGNGSLLTGIVASGGSAITNGNSNVTVNANSNVTVSITGVANTAVFYASGLTLGTGNITSGNAVLGNLVTSNYFSGNGSLLASITGANVTGTVANATYAVTSGSATNAGTVTTAAQPNITSVGTLTSLAVTGNIGGANLTGNHYGTGSALSSLTGANVTGTVANATYAVTSGSATTAGTVTTTAQPNISSIGTLNSLTVGGISNLGPNSNVIITGGTTGQVLTTNGSGNLSWSTPSSGGGSSGFDQTFLLMGA